MNKMSAADFDTWLDFYNLNEEWVQKSIFFRESRFPFNIDDTLKMLAQKADPVVSRTVTAEALPWRTVKK